MDKLKKTIKKIISKHSDCFCSPWSELQKDIFETIDCDSAEKRLQSKLRLSQSIRNDDLSKEDTETYAEELSRLYFALCNTIDEMDTALKSTEDYPAELSKDAVIEVRAFLKEVDALLESEFELFVKFSDK